MAKNTVFSKKYTLNINGNLVSLDRPKIMGILNITPDSFYAGSRSTELKQTVVSAESMVENGADFLDIGGYSSRPNAIDISIEEEIKRVVPVISAVKKALPQTYVSIDTFRSQVAEAAINEGADLINDISGGDLDPHMFDLITKTKVPYILMHMRGNPQNMVTKTDYSDILKEILESFKKKINLLHKKGVSNLILDPGFGFAKNIGQNFKLLKELDQFKALDCPILIGVSRKSMIYKSLDTTPALALNGTSILNTIGIINGANILRVHDIKEAKEVVKLVELTYN